MRSPVFSPWIAIVLATIAAASAASCAKSAPSAEPQVAAPEPTREWKGELNGLAVDPSGRLYVGARSGFVAALDGFESGGLRSFGSYGTGPGQFRSSMGIGVLPDGRLLVVDRRNQRLVALRMPDGSGWEELNLAAEPFATAGMRGAHVGADGRIYLTDEARARIWRLDSLSATGAVSFGVPGSGRGQFKDPCGVTTDGRGRIYVVDSGNARIVRIDDMEGSGWVAFGQAGEGTGRFVGPYFAAVDRRGRVVVADSHGGRLVRVDDMDGSGWTSWEPAIPAGEPRLAPMGLVVDAEGRIIFNDMATGRNCRIDDLDGSGFRSLDLAKR